MRFFCLFLFFFHVAYCDLVDPNIQAVTEGDPTCNICDSVNLLTGDFIAHSEDIIVQGAQPIRIYRSYVSGDGKGSKGGWQFFPHLKLKMIANKRTKKKGKVCGKDYRRITVAEPNGSTLVFKRQDKKGEIYKVDFEKHGKGITNLAKGAISGQTNLKNHYLWIFNKKTIKIYCADGTIRTYRKSWGNVNKHFLLNREELPNGNRLYYEYDDHDRLIHFYSTNRSKTKRYAWCRLRYQGPPDESHDFRVKTSDGRTLSYQFWRKEKRHECDWFYLTKVERPDLPNEEQKYTHPKKTRGHFLKSRSLPDNRQIQADYYAIYEDDIIETEDPRYTRVKTLAMPVGKDKELITTHRLHYKISWEKTKKGEYKYFEDGETHVFDAYNNKTILQFAPNFLPLNVRYFDGNTLHHTTNIIWNPFGELQEKSIHDAKGALLITRKLTYDERGNVIQEDLLGNFTALHAQDKLTSTFAYNEKNQLTRKEEESGLCTEYTYLNRSNRPLTKFISDQDGILLREFYYYDNESFLVCQIIDDGKSKDPDDLDHVTLRKIKRITRKQTQPALDLPEIIEEKVLNLETKEEILLQKIHLHYDKKTQIIQKDIYDAEENLQFQIPIHYDERGNIVEQQDAHQQVTKSNYDIHGNLSYEEDPSGKATTQIYDFANRLCHVEESSPNRTLRITKYQYDFKGNRTLTVDPFGNETHYQYDPFGHITQIHHPNGLIEKFEYDSLGNETCNSNSQNQVIRKQNNHLGKPLHIIHPNGAEEYFTYSKNGQVKTHTSPKGVVTTYTYDALGRKTKETLFDTTDTQIAEESFIYNSFHLLSHTDRMGVTTQYTYDLAGRKKTLEKNQILTQFSYDSLGRIQKETLMDGENSLITIYERDLLDRVIKETKEDLSGKVLYSVSYTYDTQGNQTSITTTNGTEYFTYDCFNRLICQEDPLGNKTLTAFEEDFCDNQGQTVLRKTTTDPSGRRTIEIYDTSMQLSIKEIQNQRGQTLSLEEYHYDSLGNCTLQKNSIYEGTTLTKTIDISKIYDCMGQVISLTESGKTTTFSYTHTGKIQEMCKPDGVTLTYLYNDLDELIRLTSSDETVDYSYEYNENGQLISSYDHIQETTTTRLLDPLGRIIEETLANGLIIKNQYDTRGRRKKLILPQGFTITYQYDPLHLKTVSAIGLTAHYEYDQAGNLISQKQMNLSTRFSYHYDAKGRKINLNSPYFHQTLTYDLYGNITTMQKDTTLCEYLYDQLNQLIQEDGHTYTYDSAHNRTSKDDTPYEIEDLHTLISTDKSQFTYDPNGNPITKNSTSYLYDALGRLTEVIEKNRRLVFTYDSFHRRMSKTLYILNRGTWVQQSHLNFLYDGDNEIGSYKENGKPFELRILGRRSHAERDTLLIILRRETFIPLHDLQGNIAKLIAYSDGAITTFTYGAFGEESPIEHPNPWRYASKRLDPETGLIFFGKRYYDPDTGRWLTPDPSPITDSINLCAYVHNNPLIYLDLYGLLYGTMEPGYFSELAEMSSYQNPPPPSITFRAFESNMNYYSSEAEFWTMAKYSDNLLPYYERSSIFDLNRPEVQNRMLVYINGIGNTREAARQNAIYISDLAGGVNVHVIHNATHGSTLDIKELRMNMRGIATEPSLLFQQLIQNNFGNSGPGTTMFFINHSQGGAHAKNGILSYDNEEHKKRIFMLQLASPAYLDSTSCGGVLHIRSKGDFLPLLFADTPSWAIDSNLIIDLDPHPNANRFFDHALQSPTYKRTIRVLINYYLKYGVLD